MSYEIDYDRQKIVDRIVVDGLPRELRRIVADYADDRPIWPAVDDDSAGCVLHFDRDEDKWYRIVADRPVSSYDNRWRVQVEFSQLNRGWIAVGITAASAGMTAVVNGRTWSKTATADDLLLRTNSWFWTIDSATNVDVYQNGCVESTNAFTAYDGISSFEINNGRLYVIFENVVGMPREYVADIPLAMLQKELRPCVVVCGFVIARFVR